MRYLPRSRDLFVLGAIFPALLVLLAIPAKLCAQQNPSEISATEATSLPYRLSGRLNGTFGHEGYFGTSSYIRRYTGLTAGHMLYDPKKGLATDLYYQPAFYDDAVARINVGFFAVLSGYQSAANVDPNSIPAFDYDTGYVIFTRAALGNEWADFAANTDALTNDASFLVLGYAGQTFPGNEEAFVNIGQPFYQLDSPALYENASYYTQGGMSGGPLYVTTAAGLQVAAVTVAGTSSPDPALSDVRAILPADQALFTEAEYSQGLITSGILKGPAAVAAGSTANYKTGVIFADGMQEGRDLTPRYDELYLRAAGTNRQKVTITKVRTGKFRLKFSNRLASGDTITLDLLRNTLAVFGQTPLKTLTVTIK